MLVALFAANISFIGFNDLPFTSKLVCKMMLGHRFTNTMREKPSGLKANLQTARKAGLR